LIVMSALSSHPPNPPTKRPPRLWLRLLLCLLLLAALPFAWFLFERARVNWRLRAAWAEADRTDPGWRYDELQAKRATIPDEENGAIQVARALEQLPKGGYAVAFKNHIDPELPVAERIRRAHDIERTVDDLLPNVRLSPQQALMLQADLDEWATAVREAHKLAHYRRGRFPPPRTPWGEPPPELSGARSLARLLEFDALVAASRGDSAQAAQSCVAGFALARCIGDEPNLPALLVRVALDAIACGSTERVLGQCEPPADELALLQSAVAEEAEQPLWLWMTRAERANVHFMFREVAAGRVKPEEEDLLRRVLLEKDPLQIVRESEPTWLDKWRRRISMDWTAWETEAMERISAWVRIASMPIDEQYPAYKTALGEFAESSVGMASRKLANAAFRTRAQLRAAYVALAIERFRQEQGRWPEKLEELMPGYLEKVPFDVFTGQQIVYRRLADGVAVYSVGPDEKDNHGKTRYLPNDTPEYPESLDFGMRLWDVSKRRVTP
jgi:hypothetical protein